MPQIIVTTGHEGDESTVTLRERVNASDFESECFAANLVERLGWAVGDATEAEDEGHTAEPEERPAADKPRRNRPITGERRSTKQRDKQLEPVGAQ